MIYFIKSNIFKILSSISKYFISPWNECILVPKVSVQVISLTFVSTQYYHHWIQRILSWKTILNLLKSINVLQIFSIAFLVNLCNTIWLPFKSSAYRFIVENV